MVMNDDAFLFSFRPTIGHLDSFTFHPKKKILDWAGPLLKWTWLVLNSKTSTKTQLVQKKTRRERTKTQLVQKNKKRKNKDFEKSSSVKEKEISKIQVL